MDEKSKEYLLEISNLSLRTIINYLEKLYLYKEEVDIKLCKKVCTNVTQKKYEEYFECIKKNNCSDGINILYSIYDQGYSVIDILDSLFLNAKNSENLEEEIKYRMIKYICKYITAFHIIHEHMLELCFITNNLCEIVKQ